MIKRLLALIALVITLPAFGEITQVQSTTSQSLTETSDTLVTDMTVTPAAGDYLLVFNAEIRMSGSAGGDRTTFSVYVGGTQLAHTEREWEEDPSSTPFSNPVTINAKISPNGSQAVEIKYRTSFASTFPDALNREMVLFPMPSAGTNYEQSATLDDTIATATWTTVVGMAVTPAADDYLVLFSSSVRGDTSGDENSFRLSVGGTPVAHTVRTSTQEASAVDVAYAIFIIASISPNGSQEVAIEWQRTTGTGTQTVNNRTMNLVPVASGDIFQATGTVTDSDATTTDVQIDDMLISSPGADDYLCLFSSYYFISSTGSDTDITYSFREGGVKITNSDRVHSMDATLDATNLPANLVMKCTVTSTNNLQVYWQSSATDSRDSLERTFVAMREASATSSLLLIRRQKGE